MDGHPFIYCGGMPRRVFYNEIKGLGGIPFGSAKRLVAVLNSWSSLFGILAPELYEERKLTRSRYDVPFALGGIVKILRKILSLWKSGEMIAIKELKLVSDWFLHLVMGNSLKHSIPDLPKRWFLKNGCPTLPLGGKWKSLLEDPLGKGSFLYYEVYSLKGSYPGPPVEVCLESIEGHANHLRTSVEIPKEISTLAHNWALRFPRLKKEAALENMHLTNNTSSTQECKIREGGRAKWIKETISRVSETLLDFVSIYFDQDSPEVIGQCLITGEQVLKPSFPRKKEELIRLDGKSAKQTKEVLLLLGCLDEAHRAGFLKTPVLRTFPKQCLGPLKFPEELPLRTVNVSVITEQGFKARIVTINPAWISTLFHLERTYLFGLLSDNPEVPSLSSDEGTVPSYIRDLNKMMAKMSEADFKDWELNSLDLKNATDTFSLELMRSLSEGVLAGAPPIIRWLNSIFLGPVRVTMDKCSPYYRRLKPEIQEILKEGYSRKRGPLMGDAPSWALLNLHNQFLWHLAGCSQAVLPENPLLAKWEDFKFPTSVETWIDPWTSRCGDDQASIARADRCRRFEALLTLCGCKIGVGSHFGSSKRIFYTKNLLELSFKNGTPSISYIDILRIRQIVGPDSRLPGKKEIPTEWSRGPALSNELRWWKGDPYLGASLAAFYLHYSFIQRCQRAGIEPFLPRKLGGLGFPYFDPERIPIYSSRVRKAVSHLTRDDTSLETTIASLFLEDFWNPRKFKKKKDAWKEWESTLGLLLGTDYNWGENLTREKFLFFRIFPPGDVILIPNAMFSKDKSTGQVPAHAYQAELKSKGWKPLIDSLRDLKGYFKDPWDIEKNERVAPSIEEIGFRFRTFIKETAEKLWHGAKVPERTFNRELLNTFLERIRWRFWYKPLSSLIVPYEDGSLEVIPVMGLPKKGRLPLPPSEAGPPQVRRFGFGGGSMNYTPIRIIKIPTPLGTVTFIPPGQ